MILKEDNLGLGAKRNQGDECTGLDGLKDLLGRLNGKSEEVIEKERTTRENLKMSLYLERKFGNMRFVSGGLLVGDKIAGLQPEREESSSPSGDGAESSASADSEKAQAKTKKEKKPKKRRADAEEEALATTETPEKREKKKRKKEKRRKTNEEDTCEALARPGVDENLDRGDAQGDRARGTQDSEDSGAKSSGREKKREKKDKKKKKKQEIKKSEKNQDVSCADDDSGTAEELDRRKADGVSTPLSESDPPAVSGRHFARRRFIAQKRQAMLDPQALNQVRCPALATYHTYLPSDLFRDPDLDPANSAPDLHDQNMTSIYSRGTYPTG